jgi:hypothetical protein
MNTFRKGDLFEEKACEILSSAVKALRFGLDPDCCHIERKKGYYSKDRNSDIIFDISMEVIPPGADQVHILYLIEVKDYKGLVPVNDVEEFLSKIQQVAGLYVKGVLITTSNLQQGALNLVKAKNLMWIKVDGHQEEIKLYNKSKNKAIQHDLPVIDWQQQMKQLEEIKTLYTGDSAEMANVDWDNIVRQFLERELNAKVNWEQPGDKALNLEYLSKKILDELAINVLNNFNPNINAKGLPVSIEAFMEYMSKTYGLQFSIEIEFAKDKLHLNGYFDRKSNTVHVNPETRGTGHFAFVCMHEIAHFLLHQNLNISQQKYDGQADSSYDPVIGKHRLEKEKHWIEWQANYFAASLLMPIRSLLWQLIEWQIGMGIGKRGYIWVDNQPCNILDYKKAITILAFKFETTRSILENRMADHNIIRYQKKRSFNSYRLFGSPRQARTIRQLLYKWSDTFLSNYDNLLDED